MTRNIAIVGAGAIGGWIAAKLVAADRPVTLVTRGGTLQSIKRDGLRLREGGTETDLKPSVLEDTSALPSQDVVIIAVKAPSLASAAKSARPLIGPQTIILPMLNGVPWWFTQQPLKSVDPDGSIAAAFRARDVLGCVVHASCFRSAPNEVTVKNADKLILGEISGAATERLSELCTLFEAAGIRCEASENVRRAIWYKLWGNATVNPLSALTRATADKLLGDPAIRSFMSAAMGELAQVGAAVGCPIAESPEDRMAVTARLGAFKSSMLQDVESGRQIELEALLGAPREIARRVGIATPQLDRIYALTHVMGQSLGLL